MHDKHTALKITKTANGNRVIDSEIRGGVEIGGRNTLFLRTKISSIYKKHEGISIVGMLALLASIATIYSAFFMTDEPAVEINNSSDSIVTVGQIGDNTLIINKETKKPTFSVGSFTDFTKDNEGLLSSSFLVEVLSTVALKGVYIEIPFHSLTSCNIEPAQQGVVRAMSCNVINNTVYIKLVDAIGLYKVSIFTSSGQSSKPISDPIIEYESYTERGQF